MFAFYEEKQVVVFHVNVIQPIPHHSLRYYIRIYIVPIAWHQTSRLPISTSTMKRREASGSGNAAATQSSTNADNDADTSKKKIRVVRLWKLPNNFFSLSPSQQRKEMQVVTTDAPILGDQPRPACDISILDDTIAVTFFLVTLGFPLVLVGLWCMTIFWNRSLFWWVFLSNIFLAFHPMPSGLNVSPFKFWFCVSYRILMMARFYEQERP